MVCLYGSFTGMDIITYLQANLSPWARAAAWPR